MAWRVRRLITMAEEEEAFGAALFRPLSIQDDALLVSVDGLVAYAGPYSVTLLPLGVPIQDLGEVTMVPAAVNAHTHIQLSHLAGRTLWGQGFTPWLRSLVPLLTEPLSVEAMGRTTAAMAAAGTAVAGDFSSHGLAMAARACLAAGMACSLLAEWFGFFNADTNAVWPPHVQPVLENIPPSCHLRMAPAGHALYSTRRETLNQAHAWCRAHALPFSMHLAESPEETQALTSGDGPLVDFYAPRVLPANWRAPGMPPVELAARWGLLGPETLAVHCVQCDATDMATLAASGTHVCLCPRSNAHLAVGIAPVSAMVTAGVRLCLGSDGLTSNTDMNVWQDALVLLRQGLLPAMALLRLLTRNGAKALYRDDVGFLAPGMPARWALLPEEMVWAL